jgi:hypothetical protein
MGATASGPAWGRGLGERTSRAKMVAMPTSHQERMLDGEDVLDGEVGQTPKLLKNK